MRLAAPKPGEEARFSAVRRNLEAQRSSGFACAPLASEAAANDPEPADAAPPAAPKT